MDQNQSDFFDADTAFGQSESKKRKTEQEKESKSSQSNSNNFNQNNNTNRESSNNARKETVDLSIPASSKTIHQVIPFIWLALFIFTTLCLVSNNFCNPENSLGNNGNESAHFVGVVGYYVCWFFNGMFSYSAYLYPILMLTLFFNWKKYVDKKQTAPKLIIISIFPILTSMFFQILFRIVSNYPEGEEKLSHRLSSALSASGSFHPISSTGGVIGGFFGDLLYGILAEVGSITVLVLVIIACLFYIIGVTPQYLVEKIHLRSIKKKKKKTKKEEQKFTAQKETPRKDKKTADDNQAKTKEEKKAEKRQQKEQQKLLANQRRSEKMAPMPIPHLSPNDGEELFVPTEFEKDIVRPEDFDMSSLNDNTFKPFHDEVYNAETAVPQKTVVQTADMIFPKEEPIATKKKQHAETANGFNLDEIFINLDDDKEEVEPQDPYQSYFIDKNLDIPEEPTKPIFIQKEQPIASPIETQDETPETSVFEQNEKVVSNVPDNEVITEVPIIENTKPKASSALDFLTENNDNMFHEEPKVAEPVQQPQAPQKNLENQPQTPIIKPASGPIPSSIMGQTPQKNIIHSPVEEAPKPVKEPPKQDIGMMTEKSKLRGANYSFPPYAYLHQNDAYNIDSTEVEESKKILLQTLSNFNVSVDSIRYSNGPTVTRYEITPAPGVRVKSILNLTDDIALALSVKGIRMEAPIPGKAAIGVEVPKQTPSTVYLRKLLENPRFNSEKSKLYSCLGVDITDTPVFMDIAKMPHLLIAGATGMGKSVCVNSIIMSLLYKANADEVKLIMIDPKKVEFTRYKNIPHLIVPIISQPKDAAGALVAAVEEMERRYNLLTEVGVTNIDEYNEVTKTDPDKPFMPKIVIIIDELADLMLQGKEIVETPINRLLAKARASGIHLIIATQRPSVNVITGVLKANLNSRIALPVASQVDSKVILDHAGAEKLVFRGDMLFAPIGSLYPQRVQGAFVSNEEVEKVCDFIREANGTANYSNELLARMKNLSDSMSGKFKGDASTFGNDSKQDMNNDRLPSGKDGEDSKYADAVRIAVEEKRISTSLLQRKLSIGYSRAAKILDRMQEENIIAAPEGSKPRAILITPEQYISKFVNPTSDEEVQEDYSETD